MNGCIYRTADNQCQKYSDPVRNTMSWCVGNEPCDGRTPSNADRLRAMSDEELAVWMNSIIKERNIEVTCAEYIDKQAFNYAIRDAVRKYPNTFYNGLEVARQIAHDMDAADVQPVRHGRWVLKSTHEDDPEQYWECSICGCGSDSFDTVYHTPYCPNCGAKMDTKEPEAVYDPDKFFGRK